MERQVDPDELIGRFEAELRGELMRPADALPEYDPTDLFSRDRTTTLPETAPSDSGERHE
ncbi:hypothetical protein [Halosimplex sp. TS25]|uniref:hypothetical protein n=1 Tax=Halosimplex rarum TaxID=3396619 RepID=UPI0039EA910A